MALSIQTNVASLSAVKKLNQLQTLGANDFNRLSSGVSIQMAREDAATLSISPSSMIRQQTASLFQAERSRNDVISVLQVAEGSSGQIGNLLTRMKDLATQSADGQLTDGDRAYLSTEFNALREEIDTLAKDTSFNGKKLLDGTFNESFKTGVTDREVNVQVSDLTKYGLGIQSADITSLSGSVLALNKINEAANKVQTERSNAGQQMNQLQSIQSNMQQLSTNFQIANQRIRDVDVAVETAMLSRNQILTQAGVSVLAQANQNPQLALRLLS